jgi:AraC-like DNA-binding protein
MSTPVVATLLRSATARAALRRGLPRGRVRLASCRSVAALERCLATRCVDAVVVDVRLPGAAAGLVRLRTRFPTVPRFAYAAFRPDDADLLILCVHDAAAHPIVEGVEDPVAWDLILPHTASAVRLGALEGAARILRLTDDLQLRAWHEVLRGVAGPLRTAAIARALGVSREHLSRQFGAGGAPNLKRVIDLARTATAADLLANPGYSVRAVAGILGFASASHLAGASRRIAGVTARHLPELGPRGVLAAFVRGRTRSRA